MKWTAAGKKTRRTHGKRWKHALLGSKLKAKVHQPHSHTHHDLLQQLKWRSTKPSVTFHTVHGGLKAHWKRTGMSQTFLCLWSSFHDLIRGAACMTQDLIRGAACMTQDLIRGAACMTLDLIHGAACMTLDLFHFFKTGSQAVSNATYLTLCVVMQ